VNHHKVQSIKAASPCRAGDIISIDQTGWGVASGFHWDFDDPTEPDDDLFLWPEEQRKISNEDGDMVVQIYVRWNMPNGTKIGRNGGLNGNWWLSRRDNELSDFWYTMNSSYENALSYAAGSAYAGQGAGFNETNNTKFAFTAQHPIGVALHDVWPHETGHPFPISVFRGVVRVRFKQPANTSILIGDKVRKVPYQHYAERTFGEDAYAIGYTLTSSSATTEIQYPMLEVVMQHMPLQTTFML